MLTCCIDRGKVVSLDLNRHYMLLSGNNNIVHEQEVLMLVTPRRFLIYMLCALYCLANVSYCLKYFQILFLFRLSIYFTMSNSKRMAGQNFLIHRFLGLELHSLVTFTCYNV